MAWTHTSLSLKLSPKAYWLAFECSSKKRSYTHKHLNPPYRFSACIGEDFDGLKQRVKVRHGKTFTAKTLPDNSTENFLFLEKYFVKNLKTPQKPGEHWDIEVLVWRDDNKVHEVSYTKAGKHLSPDEIRQIKNMNNREPIKEPILIEPNSIRPEKITVTSKQFLALLAEKKQQFQKFKENYLCIGQTIQQLEKRFGEGKPVNNADQAVKEWHFEKFDPKSKENWEIEVVLWKKPQRYRTSCSPSILQAQKIILPPRA